MRVPFFDLTRQTEAIRPELDAAIDAVMRSGSFIGGKFVEKFEAEIAEYTGFKHAIGVSSGTDALLLSIMMTEHNDYLPDVVVPAYSFFATIGSPRRLGCMFKMTDIDCDFNMDPNSLRKALGTNGWRPTVIPVHLFGRPVNPEVYEIARQRNLFVIDDAAQAIGAIRGDGLHGNLTCFSFFPAKTLGCFGDGGLVATNDDALAKEIRILRNHGAEPKYYHSRIGGNFRLDALQAALLSVKLRHLDGWIARRKEIAECYNCVFANCEYVISPRDQGVYAQFVIQVPYRDELRTCLTDNGIGTEIYYPVPLHLQECFGERFCEGQFPSAEGAAAASLALPIFPEMTIHEIAHVPEIVDNFFFKRCKSGSVHP